MICTSPYVIPDCAPTYGEIVAMLDFRGIVPEPVEEAYQEASLFGKQFAGSGGVAAAVLQVMKEMGEDPSVSPFRKKP